MVLLQHCRWENRLERQGNFAADFIRLNFNFIYKTTNLLFEPPDGGVRGNVSTLSTARWRVGGRRPIRHN